MDATRLTEENYMLKSSELRRKLAPMIVKHLLSKEDRSFRAMKAAIMDGIIRVAATRDFKIDNNYSMIGANGHIKIHEIEKLFWMCCEGAIEILSDLKSYNVLEMNIMKGTVSTDNEVLQDILDVISQTAATREE
jgi:hypothetical protein